MLSLQLQTSLFGTLLAMPQRGINQPERQKHVSSLFQRLSLIQIVSASVHRKLKVSRAAAADASHAPARPSKHGRIVVTAASLRSSSAMLALVLAGVGSVGAGPENLVTKLGSGGGVARQPHSSEQYCSQAEQILYGHGSQACPRSSFLYKENGAQQDAQGPRAGQANKRDLVPTSCAPG